MDCVPGFSVAGIPDDLQKFFMDPGVFIQFRMKGESQLIIVLYADDPVFYRSQNLCIFIDVRYIRRTDKSHGNFAQRSNSFFRMKASKLSSVGISAHTHGNGAKMTVVLSFNLRSQKDQSGAGSQNGHSVFDSFFQGLKHIKLF